MALGKMLKLGGMENAVPKTAQTPFRFRVARNVCPSTNLDLVPRSDFAADSGQPTNVREYVHLARYGSSVFSMAAVLKIAPNFYEYDYFLDGVKLPRSSFQGGAILGPSDFEGISSSVLSLRNNNTLYLFNPSGGLTSFFKYDGVEITGCGSPAPKFSCAQYTTAGTLKYVRVIQHRIDFDNIEVASDVVTFPIATATTAILLDTTANAGPLQGQDRVTPGSYYASDSNNLADLYFKSGTTTYNSSTNTFTVTTSDTNITSQSQVGCYVFLANSSTPLNNPGFAYFTSAVAGANYRLIALKVTSVSPTGFTLSGNDAKVKIPGADSTWKTINLPTTNTMASSITAGFRKLYTVWASDQEEGRYSLRGCIPSFPESVISGTSSIDVSSVTTPYFGFTETLPVSVGLTLGDWYDTTIQRLSFNTSYPFDPNAAITGFTNYQGILCWWGSNIVWYSDTSTGGSLEMTSGSSRLRLGVASDGDIVACAGNENFLVVSRQLKNYYITGELVTGNIRIQEITEINVGAWQNNCLISVKDSIILINSLGVYQVALGGRGIHLSAQIPKNFSRYDGYQTDVEDVVFKIQGTSGYPGISGQDGGIDVAYDSYRELLIFIPRYSTDNCALVFYARTGEFYEWHGMSSGKTKGVVAVNGRFYLGRRTGALNTSTILKEQTDSKSTSYATAYPIKLYSTWLTAGEPSLEKKLLQIKLFGNFTNGVNVVHYKDWNITNKITNAFYIPTAFQQLVGLYSNKKRLTSDSLLAASVGFEVTSTGGSFQLESMEVEFMPIQSGVKR